MTLESTKQILAALTQPAPWFVSTDEHGRCVVLDASAMWVADCGPAPAEAAFIAAAPTLVASLVDEVATLRAALAEAVDAWEGWACDRQPGFKSERLDELRRLAGGK